MIQQLALIVLGPTGVGKTDFVDELARHQAIEIINGDVGQMYIPLSIGTAKPDLESSIAPHHLFNILAKPVSFSAMKYRARVEELIVSIWKRGALPVIVGGSSFYLLSLFFPAHESPDGDTSDSMSDEDVWQELYRIDPERANQIDPHDTYRIKRALAIWHATGTLPSLYKPSFNPFASCMLVWLARDRAELYERINERVMHMIESGWIEEVQKLVGTEWESFLKHKKIIGYDAILEYLSGTISKDSLIALIQKRTRNYAKRQITFWRSFKEKIEAGLHDPNAPTDKTVMIKELNLTHDTVESYIKQLKIELLRK